MGEMNDRRWRSDGEMKKDQEKKRRHGGIKKR